jgi:hypothetical protein
MMPIRAMARPASVKNKIIHPFMIYLLVLMPTGIFFIGTVTTVTTTLSVRQSQRENNSRVFYQAIMTDYRVPQRPLPERA